MKTALKSKRRRARKKEEKKKCSSGRRRNNSGGSEGSSSEDLGSSEHMELSHSEDDGKHEDDEFEQIDEEEAGECEECGNDQRDLAADASQEAVTKEKGAAAKKEKMSVAEAGGEGSVEENEADREQEQSESDVKEEASEEISEACVKGTPQKSQPAEDDFRTSVTQSAVAPKQSKIVQDIKAKLASPGDSVKEDDSDDENLDERTSPSDGSVKPSSEQNKAAGKVSPGSQAENSGDTFYTAGSISKPGDLQRLAESGASIIRVSGDAGRTEGEIRKEESEREKDENDVETVLSWDDGGRHSDEHKTQCAFKFTNSVLFDLDID